MLEPAAVERAIAAVRHDEPLLASDRVLVLSALELLKGRLRRAEQPGLRRALRDQRDSLIREVDARLGTGGSTRRRALAIQGLAARYVSVSWPRDQHLATCPTGFRGSARELLWQALQLKSAVGFPTSLKSFEAILK